MGRIGCLSGARPRQRPEYGRTDAMQPCTFIRETVMDQRQIPKYSGDNTIIRTNDGMAVQQDDRIHTLNYTASEIFELCNGERTVGDICIEMRSRYPDETIDPIVGDFLIRLRQSGLIVFSE